MVSMCDVSIVIGSYNRLQHLKGTIASLRMELLGLRSEIIVVDGGSDDGTVRWLIEQKDIITILQHNRGSWRGKPIERKSWGYFMNLGFKAASGEYICMLSDDCLVIPGAIQNGLADIDSARQKNKRVAMSAFYWRNWPEQKTYWVGKTWGDRLFVNHGLYLREALEKVHFIDDEGYFFYHADGDLALRIWEAGYICVDAPRSFIEHYSDANHEVRTSNLTNQKRDWKTYSQRWEKLGKPTSDWIEVPYTDTTNTADRYWKSKKRLLRRVK